METIKDKLKQLRLSSIAESLESGNSYALANKVSYLDFLELLLEDEQATRQAAAYIRKLSTSRLSEQKTLETFDFSYQPELDKRVLMVYDVKLSEKKEEERLRGQ